MVDAAAISLLSLDGPTLSFVAACVAGLMGLFLIFAWLQQRNIRALAWWGSAYLIGASSIAFWGAPAAHRSVCRRKFSGALMFFACGMIWNGVRQFHGRRLWPVAAFAGAIVWLIASQLPGMREGSRPASRSAPSWWRSTRSSSPSSCGASAASLCIRALAAIVVPCCTRRSFLLPLGIKILLPAAFAAGWQSVLALETMIYAVGTAFIVLLTVKDHHVHPLPQGRDHRPSHRSAQSRRFPRVPPTRCLRSRVRAASRSLADVRPRQVQVDQRPLRPCHRRQRVARLRPGRRHQHPRHRRARPAWR